MVLLGYRLVGVTVPLVLMDARLGRSQAGWLWVCSSLLHQICAFDANPIQGQVNPHRLKLVGMAIGMRSDLGYVLCVCMAWFMANFTIWCHSNPRHV